MTEVASVLVMIRALAGAPLTVLMVLLAVRTPVKQAFLRQATGFSDPTINDSLALLATYGLANETGRYTWQIAAGAKQLPLINLLLGQADEETQELPAGDENETISTETGTVEEAGEISSKNYRANDSSSSRSISRESSVVDLPPDSRTDSSKKISANREELEKRGVREPARSRLAGLEHVTPELVAYHCETAQNLGLAIYRIEHNFPAKPRPAAPVQPELPVVEIQPHQPGALAPGCREAEDLWTGALVHLSETIPKPELNAWISPAGAASFADDRIRLDVGNRFAREQLLNYRIQILDALEKSAGKPIQIDVTVEGREV